MTEDVSSPSAVAAVAAAAVAGSSASSSSSTSSSSAGSEPSVNQKLFLVVSVALATVCFFTNIVQVAVFARPSVIRSVKSVLLLSQALSGLVAAFVVAFPIHVISARGVVGEEGYATCYLGHSAVILLTALTSLGSSTLLLFHQYMKVNDPRRFMTAGSNVVGWSVGVSAVWFVAIVVSVLPYAGWNSWEVHDARCHLSTLWPLSFTAFLTFLVGGHVAAALLMWASTRATQLKAMASRRGAAPPTNCPDAEEAPIANHVQGIHNNSSGSVRVGGWCVSVGSLVPMLAHVVVASSCAASRTCQASPSHYHEEAAALPWASLLLAAAAVTNPLLYVFTDDQVSSSTLLLLSRVCCWWCERRKQRLVPRHQEPHDAETNVYVTNDTDHLVSDNT
ncbi:uncharacterized protein LOC121863807 isoform X2 [Homarus americanus]|uniref:uncharacterized protein LOC121863807 isoform X2 n=1 Tax=Homarus americanus TaxID=6706 RepID=UPI001C48215E|nr:uncharacterized protein LOC121863807 isoform X2 [Homarus americanus]